MNRQRGDGKSSGSDNTTDILDVLKDIEEGIRTEMDQKIGELKDQLMDKINKLQESDKAQQNSIENADERLDAHQKAIDDLMEEIAQLKECKCDKSD